MAKRAVIVKYTVKSGKMEVLLALLRDHVTKTKATEPGCLQFDILRPEAEDDVIRLHEVYADGEAFRIHNASAQLASYKKASEPLLTDRTGIWCTVEP